MLALLNQTANYKKYGISHFVSEYSQDLNDGRFTGNLMVRTWA